MGDQWDWIESYCEICNRPLGHPRGRCEHHADKTLHKTKEELQAEENERLLTQLEKLIDDIKFVQNPDDSKDEAKRLFTLIQKIHGI